MKATSAWQQNYSSIGITCSEARGTEADDMIGARALIGRLIQCVTLRYSRSHVARGKLGLEKHGESISKIYHGV